VLFHHANLEIDILSDLYPTLIQDMLRISNNSKLRSA